MAVASIWLVGAGVYLVCEAVAAARFAGYSYAADYISDLGVSPVMNYGAFMLHGSLFLLGAVVFVRGCPTLGWAGWIFVLAAAANAVGNVLIGTFRSAGVEAAGTSHWHTIGAGLAIVGGNVAVIVAGIGGGQFDAPPVYRFVSIAIGIVGILCLGALVIDGLNSARVLPVGLAERGSVYTIVAWEIMTGVVLMLTGYGCAARNVSVGRPAESSPTSKGRSSNA